MAYEEIFDGDDREKKHLLVPPADMDAIASTLQYCRQWQLTFAPERTKLIADIDAALRRAGHEPWPEHAREPK
jgi:hypothetical protein